jgi:hypothetical protein
MLFLLIGINATADGRDELSLGVPEIIGSACALHGLAAPTTQANGWNGFGYELANGFGTIRTLGWEWALIANSNVWRLEF